MKLKVLALGIAALFLTSSCSEDDAKEPVINAAELAGDWYYVSYVVDGQIIAYQHPVCENSSGGAVVKRDYVEFSSTPDEAGHNFTSVEWLPECAGTDTTMGVYTFNGQVLTVTIDEDTAVTGTVLELTANKLVLQTVYDFDGDGDQEMVIETYAANP